MGPLIYPGKDHAEETENGTASRTAVSLGESVRKRDVALYRNCWTGEDSPDRDKQSSQPLS